MYEVRKAERAPLPFPSSSIYKCHDDNKDKDFELEISWICPESGGKHQTVPADIVAVSTNWKKGDGGEKDFCSDALPAFYLICSLKEAGRKAKEALDDEMED